MVHSAKTVILHIGRFKTGSSSLQKWMSENEETMARLGIHYPRAGRLPVWPFAHHAAINALVATGRFPEEFVEEIASSALDVVISCEEFSDLVFMDEALMDEVVNTFRPYRVEIVMFVRRPSAWMKSWYREMVMRGDSEKKTETFSSFLRYEQSKLDDLLLISPWRDRFPDATLHIVSYEEAMLGKGVVSSFFSAIGHETDLPDVAELRENTSMPEEFLHFLREIRPMFGDRHDLYTQIMEATWRLKERIEGNRPPLIDVSTEDKRILDEADEEHRKFLEALASAPAG